MSTTPAGEGSLEAPTRHPLDWRNPEFYDEAALTKELERVFDICHGCRRCFSLCNSFPTLFDAVDESATGEVDGVDKKVFWEVVDHCYLCDMCFMTKCPYVPPHSWNIDFPHLMLRAKATRNRKQGEGFKNKILAATDTVGNIAGIPVVAEIVNAVSHSSLGRSLLESTLGVARDAPLPKYHSRTARKRLDRLGTTTVASTGRPPAAKPTDKTTGDRSAAEGIPGSASGATWGDRSAAEGIPGSASGATWGDRSAAEGIPGSASGATWGKVALFVTCYGNRNEPDLDEDLVAVFEHNDIPVTLIAQEKCCGMPRLELGDLEQVARLKDFNVPHLKQAIDAGYDILAPIPSCVLMFKQELRLMFPDDLNVQQIAKRIFDPFEYLMLRHKAGLLKTDFKTSLGKVSYHVPCHLRVQNIGLKTRDVLKLVPDTTVDVIERCSGHNGTYGVKQRFRAASMKIGKPVMTRVEGARPAHYTSDCPMAGHQIKSGLQELTQEPEHPLKLLRIAYGL